MIISWGFLLFLGLRRLSKYWETGQISYRPGFHPQYYNVVSANDSALAKAVYKDNTLKDLVLVEAIHEIKKETTQYAKDPECLLKLKSPEHIREFWTSLFSSSFGWNALSSPQWLSPYVNLEK